jgi:hypothetical protein
MNSRISRHSAGIVKNGFVLGNTMGLGKTRSCVSVVLLGQTHLLQYLHRLDFPKLHISSPQDKNEEPIACPSGDLLPVPCYCSSTSEFHGFEPRVCATIGSGSGKSINAWHKEIVAKGILNSKWCNPKDKHSLRFVVMDDVKSLDALMDKPAEEEYMEMRIRVDADAHLRDYNARVRDCSYTQNKVTHTERPLFRVSPAINNHKDATAMRPSPSAGRFVFLCGETTLKTGVLDKTREIKIRIVRTVSTGGGEKREVEEIHHVWGRTCFDEFHNTKTENTKFAQFYDYLRTHSATYH